MQQLNLKQIAYDWVQAQIVSVARQDQLNRALQAIHPDNQVIDLDVVNRYYTDLVKSLIKARAWSWIDWWCWECDFGKASCKFSVNHQWYNTQDMTFLKFWELTCE